MLGKLTGTVAHTDIHGLIVDVGGVGYLVSTTIKTSSMWALGATCSLFTHLAVRENALDLYGFETGEELNFFKLLLSVSGIGPKSALAILNVASIETLSEAIIRGDSRLLTKVGGIGKKTAEKIVVELQDKLQKLGTRGDSARQGDTDVFEVLEALGYNTQEIRDVLKNIPGDIEDTHARVKMALKLLAK